MTPRTDISPTPATIMLNIVINNQLCARKRVLHMNPSALSWEVESWLRTSPLATRQYSSTPTPIHWFNLQPLLRSTRRILMFLTLVSDRRWRGMLIFFSINNDHASAASSRKAGSSQSNCPLPACSQENSMSSSPRSLSFAFSPNARSPLPGCTSRPAIYVHVDHFQNLHDSSHAHRHLHTFDTYQGRLALFPTTQNYQ
ncbi:hypothetical protein P280DRAFT_471460 [Massarina eburnea CBS 473.64]|uniref:Uncharacterized protein n=1 Tax=Massarina eburnea CBS 473.64 TaxID=1395130 RepID=A0A6A6RUF1_9PLEO|nr:hypothetical protein P280DRAFT_471460 [Massarina eburnea CBS 473.64]